MQYSDQTDHDNKLNYRQQSDLDMSRNEQEMQVILIGIFFYSSDLCTIMG